MLSMFKDKKGFSGLFSNQGDGASPSEAAEGSSRAAGRGMQQRCQRCWKSFAIRSGTRVEEYTCWHCEYPACRLCREENRQGLPWTCCTCAQPKSLMKLFGKTRYGTDLVVRIMAYCDQRSERILRSFFRAAAMKFTTTRNLSNGRTSAQLGSRGSRGENDAKSEGKPARLSGGLRVQSPGNSNRLQAHKNDVLSRHTGIRREVSKGSKKSPKQSQHQQPATTPVKLNDVVYSGPEDMSTSFCMPTIGTRDQDGVVEYSPCAKLDAPRGVQQQQPPQRCFTDGASPLAFKDASDDEVSEESWKRHTQSTGEGPLDAAPRTSMAARPSAFEREEPATARAPAAAATGAMDSCEVSRSTLGLRMSRTDPERPSFGRCGGSAAEGGAGNRLGTSPSPARSESPAPRFPTFAQFLDDQEAMAAQQQQLLQHGHCTERGFTQSGQSISVSPETEEDEPSRRASGNRWTGSRRVNSGGDHAVSRDPVHSRRHPATAAAAASLTPRRTTTVDASGRPSRRPSAEVSSAKKKPRRSASGIVTPRPSLRDAGAAGGVSGRRTTRASGSRRDGSAAHASPTFMCTPPLAPLAAATHTEQLSRTDGSIFPTSPFGCAAGAGPHVTVGGVDSSAQRTPPVTVRSSNSGFGFARCATATRLSYGSAQERKVPSPRVGRPQQLQRRPQSAALTRTGSSNTGVFHRQNSRTGFGRTNSSAHHLTRTASSRGYVRQPTDRPRMADGGHAAHPTHACRTAPSNAGRFGRTASSNRFLGQVSAPTSGVNGVRRPGGASPLTRTASSSHPFARQQTLTRTASSYHPFTRQQTFSRTHTATQPFARTQSANAGLRVGRTATAVPSRLVRTRSTNATFGRSNTGTGLTGGRRSGGGPASRTGTPNRTAAAHPGAAVQTSRFGRRPTSTTAGGYYGRTASTASPLLARNTPQRRGPATASPLVSSSPLKRTVTATGRSNTPAHGNGGSGGSGAARRPAAAARAADRERLVRTPTRSRFERQPTRPRTATPTAGGSAPPHKPTVESAPMLVHVTRRRATGGAGGSAASSAQTTARSTGTARRAVAGSAATTHRSSDSSTATRPLISSRNGTPKHTARSGRGSVGGDAASVKSTDSPRTVASAHGAAAPTVKRRAVPGTTRNAIPTGNVFQRLNTASLRQVAHPSPKQNSLNRSNSKM